VVVLAGVLAGCSLGGGSGASSGPPSNVMTSRLDLSHDQPGVDANLWAASSVKRMHPRRGARFLGVKCDVRGHQVVVCNGYLSYDDAPGDAVLVPQYFRIREHDGSERDVPYCPPESTGLSPAGTMPRIFCSE
jgi:hypothetical protein